MSKSQGWQPIVKIKNATFYRKYPSATEQDAASNPAIFPGLSWFLHSKVHNVSKAHRGIQQQWAVTGPSNSGKTTFLDIIRGQHICIPPAARSFPYLSAEVNTERLSPCYRNVSRAIQYVGFDGETGGVGNSGTRGAYMGARYESRREATDFSVMDFLRGNTDLNPSEEQEFKDVNDRSLEKVISDLKLETLVNMPMANLSNGQMRRTRIARSLLGKPLVLLLDEPFMGLDPSTVESLSPLLGSLCLAESPRIILALRPQDPIPDWITHVIRLANDFRIIYKGLKGRDNIQMLKLEREKRKLIAIDPSGSHDIPYKVIPQRGLTKAYEWARVRTLPGSNFDSFQVKPIESREGIPLADADVPISTNEALVEMQGVCVRYGDKEVLGGWEQEVGGQGKKGLFWTIRRGERWGVFGPNGSGKTTLFSLICSEHPQTYSLPIKVFGRGRLPQPGLPGISIFDIQSRIGQVSPEIHAFFPRNLSIRQTLESAWADTFLGTPPLTYETDVTVDTYLRWFESELNPAFTPLKIPLNTREWRTKQGFPNPVDWADDIRFGDAPFSAQRVALFLRAIIKKPDLVVLDEPFSGMDDRVRDKCILFLTWGEMKSSGVVTNTKGIGTQALSGKGRGPQRFIYNTPPPLISERPFEGLSKDQALICISHLKEEVPGVVRDWMVLPEPHTAGAARFGRFPGPLEGYKGGWDEVWGL